MVTDDTDQEGTVVIEMQAHGEQRQRETETQRKTESG